MHVFATAEIAAALFQAAITVGMALLFLYLFRRYRKQHFLWWAVAWGLYGLRLGAIISFLSTSTWAWLYWHQVATGWAALGLLWAALVFSRQSQLKPWHVLLLLFPPAWSYIAIFRLSDFMLAAAPAAGFLSLTTLWTGVVLLQYRRKTGSTVAGVLAGTFLLWGLHHLDYPVLRARGAWNPWGYYLDATFLLAVGAGILLLVIEELHQGLFTLSALSADLQRRDRDGFLDALLQRPLSLRGVRGTALFSGSTPAVAVRGVGDCLAWEAGGAPAAIQAQVAEAVQSQRPRLRSHRDGVGDGHPFTAVLPLVGHGSVGQALVIVGEAAAPFAALDDRILVAVGEQIGAALEGAELNRALASRSADLERLSVRMIQQHEEQRQRLARELHDETAQVFSALKLQLGSLREAVPSLLSSRVDRLLDLVNAGRMSIRSVTEDLRPSLLDDLGLVPALRALVRDFQEWSGVGARLDTPEVLPSLPDETELALFRAVQEGLSNVARHAQAREVVVRVRQVDDRVRLSIEDDGIGLEDEELSQAAGGPGRSGLFGMRERIAMQGGTVQLGRAAIGGLRLEVQLPLNAMELRDG